MNRHFLLLLYSFIAAGLFTTSLYAQNDQVLLTIENDEITVDEFLRVYKKNSIQGNMDDKKSAEEYLDLFINFQLKIREAYEMGLDTVSSYQEELKGYREQLARPYLMDAQTQEKILKEAHENMQYDIRAQHILIRVGPNASAEDTLQAYNKALKLRKRILNGESFGKVAAEASEDQSARDQTRGNRTIPGNRGDLGYFTVFNLVYPFEKAAYNMDVGELSMPVRTDFGYHIIKVTDKIPAQGKLGVAHIMLPKKMDSTQAVNTLDSLRTEINKGNISFAKAVKEFSTDNRTKHLDGVFPEFTSNRMPPVFIKTISTLQDSGDISKPVKSPFGYHLFMLMNRDAPGNFEEEKPSLENKIASSDRGKMQKNISARKIREDYGYKIYRRTKNEVLARVDSSILTQDWNVDMTTIPDKPIFKIDKNTYSARDFASYLLKHQKRDGKGSAKQYAEKMFRQYIDRMSLDYKDNQLEKEYPEFKHLMKEYRQGILLFNLMTEKIWSKAMKDTTGLKAFYEQQKDEHSWDERLHASIYKGNTREALMFARQLAEKGLDNTVIADSVNSVDDFNISITTEKFSKGDNILIDKTKWQEGITPVTANENDFVFIHKHEVLPPQPKKLEEIRGLIIADYQNYLEKQWVKELRSKYDFSVNEEVLENIEL
ncbi:MAG: peptidylprolyl isomerase [Bacteroidales bacterium]